MQRLTMNLTLTAAQLTINVYDGTDKLGSFWTTAEHAKTIEGVDDLFTVVANRIHTLLNKDSSNGKS